MSSTGAFWDNSPSKAWLHLLYVKPLLGAYCRDFWNDGSQTRVGLWSMRALSAWYCTQVKEPYRQGNFTAAGTWLAFPEEVLWMYWLCAQEECPLGWLRAGYVPGLVLLMGKTWWLPIIQNILISLGYFFWDTHFWITVLIFIYVFLSIPNILLTSSWEIEIQQAFIYVFVFCFASWLLWANFVISTAVCVQMTSEIKQFNCKNEETEKHHTKGPKIYGKSHPFYSVHDMTSTNATFAKWVGKLVGKGMSFHGPSLPFRFVPFIIRAVRLQAQASGVVGQP